MRVDLFVEDNENKMAEYLVLLQHYRIVILQKDKNWEHLNDFATMLTATINAAINFNGVT